MPSDTDYDSLPSPPPPRRARTGLSARGGGYTRLYGKRGASRAPPSSAAPPLQQPTRVTPAETTKKRSRALGSSSADDGELSGPSPKGKKAVKRRKSAAASTAKADGKATRRLAEGSEADVESGSEDGDVDAVEPPVPSSPAQHAFAASDEPTKNISSSTQGARAARRPTEARPTNAGASGSQNPGSPSKSSKTRPSSTRSGGTALQDKSNSTARAPPSRLPRRSAGASRPRESQEGRSKDLRSESPQKGPSTSRLQVFRDNPDAPVGRQAPGLTRRPSLPLSELPPRRARPPRRNVVRHASEPPSGPIASTGLQGSTLLPRSPAAQRRGSVSVGQAAKSLVAPPNDAASSEPLPRPAPWALSAPASPLLEPHSSSPADTASGLPVFRFTTTEFGDSPSLQLHQPGRDSADPSLGFHRLGEGEAEGMDSSFMIESWDDSATGHTPATFAEPARARDETDGDVTMRQADQGKLGHYDPISDVGDEMAEESTIRHEPPSTREDSTKDAAKDSTKDATPGALTNSTNGDPNDVDTQAEAEKAPASDAAHIPAESGHGNVEPLAEAQGDPRTDDEMVTSEKPKTRAGRDRMRIKPIHYTSTFMPARHPRWPVDEPRPEGPPSSEDELAYYLRTSGTFSSEDDLSPNDPAPSDESAKEDWLAEREVGRALKSTSRQREKRSAAYSAATTDFARLRLGEGSGGRRKEWKREILPLDQVRLPRQMREAIEAKALQLGEELGEGHGGEMIEEEVSEENEIVAVLRQHGYGPQIPGRRPEAAAAAARYFGKMKQDAEQPPSPPPKEVDEEEPKGKEIKGGTEE